MTPATLEFPPTLWDTTLDALKPYRARRVEGGCLWYGHRDGQTAYAVLVGVPKQINRPYNFEIPADALAELNTHIGDGLVVVAQIHSHPGGSTTHSHWDDAMILSRKMFSLVLPHYARLPCTINMAGVHVYDGRQWVKLAPEVGMSRLRVMTGDGKLDGPRMVDTR